MYKEPSEKATLKKSLLGWDLLEEQKLIVQSWEFQAEGIACTMGLYYVRAWCTWEKLRYDQHFQKVFMLLENRCIGTEGMFAPIPWYLSN